MTLANTTIIKCGNCGNEIEVRLYKTVNVDVDPYLKERVLSGNINSGFCDKCNTLNKLSDYFLYHDMSLDLMVYVCPERYKDKSEEITKNALKDIQEVYQKMPQSLQKPKKTAIVFGINELKEKLNEMGDLLRSELKLYSRKKDGIELIAKLYVENKNLIIESADQKVKEDLYKEINTLIENGGVYIFNYVFKDDDMLLNGALVNVDNSNFLYALKNCSYLWSSNKTYGGHVIYGFDSFFHQFENQEDLVTYNLLGSSQKDKVTQKYNMIIVSDCHKDKDYASYIHKRAMQSGMIHNFYRSISEDDRNEWAKLHFGTFNMCEKYINNYAKKDPKIDFFECQSIGALDEKALQLCDSGKFNFIENLFKKYSPTEEQKQERKIVALERMLNLKLPDSYKQFLKKFGGGYDGKTPIPGKPRIFGLSDSKDMTSALNATFFLRIKRKDISQDFVVIGFFDNSHLLCLDLRKKPEDDAHLVKINYMEENTDIKESNILFSNYLAKEISTINNKQ